MRSCRSHRKVVPSTPRHGVPRALWAVLAAYFILRGTSPAFATDTPTYPVQIDPGSILEARLLVKSSGAELMDGSRYATPGQYWVLGLPAVARAECHLTFHLDDNSSPPHVRLVGLNNKEVPSICGREEDGTYRVTWTAPQQWALGAPISVVIGAKEGPVRVQRLEYSRTDPDSTGSGIPDSVTEMMTAGLRTPAKPQVSATPRHPHTLAETETGVDPRSDVQTDAILSMGEPTSSAGWKERGYETWRYALPDIRSSGLHATTQGRGETQQPTPRQTLENAAQRHASENPGAAPPGPSDTAGPTHDLAPTQEHAAQQTAEINSALAAGFGGICIPGPVYDRPAKTDADFRSAWQRENGTVWQDTPSNSDTEWKANSLRATIETNHVAGLLSSALHARPEAQRLVSIESPFHALLRGVVSQPFHVTSSPMLQGVLGCVDTETARAPARYAGIRTENLFSVAYLEYSSLYQLLRGTNKRLWFATRFPQDSAPLETRVADYEQLLTAALLFPGVDAFEPIHITGPLLNGATGDARAESFSVLAALQNLGTEGEDRVFPSTDEIGVMLSDTAEWQAGTQVSAPDALFGLTLPLLQRGIPVQLLSLDRAADAGYLHAFKTILLSYDFQKPLDPLIDRALAEWVRRGGSLLVFGGSDAFNMVTGSWWHAANLESPAADLWKQLGVPVRSGPIAMEAPREDLSQYRVVLEAGASGTSGTRRIETVSLGSILSRSGSVGIRFSAVGAAEPRMALSTVELRVDGQTIAAFQTGSEIESRFLTYDNGSAYSGRARSATGTSSWTYQFDNLPIGRDVSLVLAISGNYRVAAGSVLPVHGRTLVGTPENGVLGKAFPRFRVGADYPITVYPDIAAQAALPTTNGDHGLAPVGRSRTENAGPELLYTLPSGGAPIWSQSIGKGLLLNIGVAPGFFSASERSAAVLRGLTQLALQRAGGVYKEPGYLRTQRGSYVIVHTFGESADIEGRTIDLFSPRLDVAEDRTVPPHSSAFLLNIGSADAGPHIAFVAGRVGARLETAERTSFFVRGPQGTTGRARVHSGGRAVSGLSAYDRLGRRLDCSMVTQGDTLLLLYPNDPDGIVVRVGWK